MVIYRQAQQSSVLKIKLAVDGSHERRGVAKDPRLAKPLGGDDSLVFDSLLFLQEQNLLCKAWRPAMTKHPFPQGLRKTVSS
jgi:hypothetical protein